MSKETLYLVDGTSLCYRSYFAIKLSTSKGFPTGAVYGFYRTLKKIISKYEPQYIGVCFDVSRKTHRQEKFKEYKIQRPPSPDELKMQIPIVKKMLASLGIQVIEKEGFEADDLIASFCKKALKSDYKVIIISSDKDFCQLIQRGKVSIYNYGKDKSVSYDDFVKDNGFKPELMVDYLSLTGDSSDNIPGARGIGKVSAAKLIKEFGSIDNIFRNLNKLNERLQGILKENEKMITLSRELVELQFPKLDLGLKDLKIKDIDSIGLYDMFSELEFKALLKEIPQPKANLDIKVKEEMPQIKNNELIFKVYQDKIFIFDESKECIYKVKLSEAKDLLSDKKIRKVSYGLKSQLAFLEKVKFQGELFDVKIAAYLLDSNLADYELNTLVSNYLKKHFSDISDEFYPYFTYQLYKLLDQRLKMQNLKKLFFDIEMPLISVLYRMQAHGVKIKAGVLDSLFKEVDKEIKELKEKIFKIAKREFNLNSPKQLGTILFDGLGIEPIKKTKTGYSTSEEVLEKLSLKHHIAKYILNYRYLNKLKTTYIEPLIEEVRDKKGALHAHFNQAVTQTGRLSSSSPNLQSIPIKGRLSSRLREAFIPSTKEGYMLSGDYSQIELRILAHLSKDENLIDAFRQGLDIHRETAALLFKVKPLEVSDSQRNIAKRVNFGIIYGMSSYGLSRELKITPIEAQNFIDDYFRRYIGVKNYTNKVYAQAEEKGFVETTLGRKRKLPDINSFNIQLRDFSRRQAVNAPIQGSCADLIKIAMVNIDNELEKRRFTTKLIMQIHDELVLDVANNELKEVTNIVKEKMEKAIKLDVPVKVNLKLGKNWGKMEEIE